MSKAISEREHNIRLHGLRIQFQNTGYLIFHRNILVGQAPDMLNAVEKAEAYIINQNLQGESNAHIL